MLNKLMLLEWKKLKQKSIIGELIIYWLIIMFMPVFFIKVVSADFGLNFHSMIGLIGAVQGGFSLLGASLISQVFIDEYKNRTISLAFSYPISRKKLFGAKVLFISLFVFCTSMISFLFTGVVTLLFDQFMPIIQWQLTASEVFSSFGHMIVRSFVVTLICFIPLFYFAIWQRATVPTVICAIVSMQLPNFSSYFHLNPEPVLAILSVLGAISVYLSIKYAEKVGEI